MWLVGRSVWQTTFGLRGSETSTAVKFFGALSCASQRMRRPSFATCTDMPSPIPPKTASVSCAISLKFQLRSEPPLRSGAAALAAGFFAAARLGAAALRAGFFPLVLALVLALFF